VAGFDLDITFKESTDELGRALLQRLQRAGRSVDLRVSYRRSTEYAFYVTVDGPLPAMQMLCFQVELELPAFADGYPKPVRRATRLRVADQLIDRYTAGVARITQSVLDTSAQFAAIPNSLRFDAGDSTELEGVLNPYSHMVTLFWLGFVPATHAVEEAHTAVEVVLKQALGKPKSRGAFFELVAEAKDRGLVTAEQHDELIELKDVRKGIKHRGHGVSIEVADKLMDQTTEVVQVLLGGINRSK